MTFALIAVIVLTLVSVIFAIQNSAVITVSFLVWELNASLALILIITLGAGILIGYLAGLPSVWKKGAEARKLHREIDDLEKVTTAREPTGSAEQDGR